MATDRRRKLLLGLVVVTLLLGLVVYRLLRPPTSAPPSPSSNRQAAAPRGSGRAEQTASAAGTPGVHLDALEAEKPKPTGPDRNLFRYKPKAPPPPPPAPPPVANPAVSAPVPTGPPQPAPPPPIPLKFIGIMGPENNKIAVLSDGRGGPINGKEGDLVLGQYRILKIGVESVEVAYADGRGRVTIRLSGQP